MTAYANIGYWDANGHRVGQQCKGVKKRETEIGLAKRLLPVSRHATSFPFVKDTFCTSLMLWTLADSTIVSKQ